VELPVPIDPLLCLRCEAMSKADLVHGLTLGVGDNSAAFADEAHRELERRGTSLDACVNQVMVQAGASQEGLSSIDNAIALVTDEVPRRAVASFTHYLGEILILQREGWGWIFHHYASQRYNLSFLVDDTESARAMLERFLRLQPWQEQAGTGQHLDDWKSLTAGADADAVLGLSDRLATAGVPHVVRPTLFTPPGDDSVALLVPRSHEAEAIGVAGTGQEAVRRLHRQAREAAESGDSARELAVYEDLRHTDSDNHAVHYNRGALLVELSRLDEAATSFMDAAAKGLAKVQPELSMARGSAAGGSLGLVGIGARLLGRSASAPSAPAVPDWFMDVELQLLAMLDHFGERRDLLHSLASLARIKGETTLAIERYQRILALQPGDEVARFQLQYLAAAGD
jgi:tetratricopeptide (TPR) repeat protein